MLDSLPPDIVQEMARRRLAEINAAEQALPDPDGGLPGDP
jgi:hypothetical protein